MKTIEERAKEWAYGYPMTPDGYLTESDMRAVATNSYIQGATEQKAIDIDKACDWLDTYLMEIGYPDDWLRDSPNIEGGRKRFRKAMEE